MAPKLYMTEMSPPSRGAMLVAQAIGLDLEYVNVNFLEKEHLKPDFVKKNPQHTVPTLEDGDFILWDSHAIASYIVTVYGKDDSLLPKDPKFRATVDQRLFFDTELFLILKRAVMPLWANTATSFSPQTNADVATAMALTETFLEQHDWIAGDRMTIADMSLVATISTLHEMMTIDGSKYPKVMAWIKRLENLPYYENTNARGARALGEVVKSKIKN